jgi:hypothetical protein
MTQPGGQPKLILFTLAAAKFILTFACFIKLGQGKDIIISFTENTRKGNSLADVSINVLIKLTFFIAIAFWVYVSWYSSRIVAYAKLYRQRTYANLFIPTLPETKFGTMYEVQQLFLDGFPRLVGYGCLPSAILFSLSRGSKGSQFPAWPFVC